MFRRTKEFCQDRLNDMLLRSGEGGVGGGEERQDYRNSELRQYWMPDAYSLECYDCNLRFNTFRRKHHCRVCGQIFCSSCSSEYIDGKSLGFNGKLRVCKFCFDFFHRFLKGLEPGASTRLLEKQPSSRESTPSTSLNQSAFYSLGAPFLEEDQCSDVVQFSLKDPTRLGRLWAKIVDVETGVCLVDGQFSGHDLVRWLTSRDESMGPEQAVAIGQALLDARFMVDEFGSKVFYRTETLYRSVQNSLFNLEENSNASNTNTSSETDCPEWLQNIPVCEPQEDEVTERKVSGAHNSCLSNDVSGKLFSKSVLDNIILSNDDPFIPEAPLIHDPKSLDSFYSKHIGRILKHLMAEERLDPQWYNCILHFAEKAVECVKLDHISRNDNVDIREYISVKKIPYGSRDKDSRIFPGIMFQNRPYCGKNSIEHARILLVRGSISFNRIKYVSLENYISQEDEYLKNICSKIKSFKPDVILVEETITYQAKLILSSAGIAIVQNVKLELLEKISRVFRSPILTSLDSIPNQPDLGSCESYKVQSFVINKDYISPDFVILESQSEEQLGCTIILRGASKKTLSKVKRLIKQIALFLNNKIYEKSFLENEFVRLSAAYCTQDIPTNLTRLPMSPFLRFSRGSNSKDLESWEFDDDETMTELDKGGPGRASVLNLMVIPEEHWGEELANFRAGVSDRVLPELDGGPMVYSLDSKFSKPLAPPYYSNPNAIPVLFSSYSPRSKAFPSYCIPPSVVEINCYGVNDLPLGVFLETFCFAESNFCPHKGCNAPIKDHIRRFCLDEGVVNLYIQSLVSPIHHNSEGHTRPPIVTWKYCVECEKLGPVVELRPESWKYSFGMFLSLLIYEDALLGGGGESVCGHSLHQQHYTCFSVGHLVVSFKFSKVKPFLTDLPSSKIDINPYFPPVESMTLEVSEIATKGTLLFSKIHEKLNDLYTKEGGLLIDKYNELNLKYEDNFKEFRNSIDSIKSLIESIEDPDIQEEERTKYSLSARRHIVGLKLYLSDKSCTWKLKLSNFIEEKRKEEKTLERTRSLSGNNPGAVASNPSDHNSEEVFAKGPDEVYSAPSRIWSNFSSNSSEIVFPNIFPSHIHYGLDSHNYIVVDEKQPSSIVAHVLSTGNYLEKRRNEMSSKPPSSSKAVGSHYDCEFFDKEHAQFYVNAYFAWEFERLRNEILVNPKDYVQSLAECEPWKSSGGKSGLHFYKTKDDRFILKEMSGVEFNCFQEFAPQYFDYVRSALDPREKKPSALAKILGVYKIGSKNANTKETHKMDFLVIENVFYGRSILEKYDLKGSMRNRLVDTKDAGGNLVLMDENLLKISCDRPIYIRQSCQKKLLHAIDRDTTFLQNAMIMDYSLIVGIDAERQELVLGIIDYIRNFSWDKKLENLIKKSGLLGGKPGTTPTIIPPKIYKKRFTEAMLKYFVVLPEIDADKQQEF